MSPGIFGISDEEDLPKCGRIPGCGDPVPEVGDPSEALEVVLGRGKGCEERLEKPTLAFGISRFHKEKGRGSMQGTHSMGDFCDHFPGLFLCKRDATPPF